MSTLSITIRQRKPELWLWRQHGNSDSPAVSPFRTFLWEVKMWQFNYVRRLWVIHSHVGYSQLSIIRHNRDQTRLLTVGGQSRVADNRTSRWIDSYRIMEVRADKTATVSDSRNGGWWLPAFSCQRLGDRPRYTLGDQRRLLPLSSLDRMCLMCTRRQ